MTVRAPRVLILGSSGMLGSTLLRKFPQWGLDTYGTVRGTGGARQLGGVLAEDLRSVQQALVEVQPDVVVNAVGVIRQRQDGQDPVTCITLNALFPHQLASLCAAQGARLIHISTDCVFSGQKGSSYLEQDFSDAHDVYGRTKFLGELQREGTVTLRTSIIGHEERGKLSLVEWFLAQTGRVGGYTQAIYSGLPTVELARVIAQFVIPRADLHGLYHVSSDPISKYDLLQLIGRVYGRDTVIEKNDKVRDNKSLDSSRFRQFTGWQPAPWEQLVREMHQDFQENQYAQR